MRNLLICFVILIKTAEVNAQQNNSDMQLKLGLPVGHSEEVYSAAFSPDGKNIVTASRDKTAKLWDTYSGKLLYSLEGHSGIVSFATYSPDGKTIVTISSDGTANLWDSQNGKLLHSMKGHSSAILSVTFSPDGNVIATSSEDSTIKLWDAHNCNLLHSMKGYNGAVNSADFSPDCKTIVTASMNSSAKVLDTKSGKLLHSLEGHGTGVLSARYSPDGKTVITSSSDNNTFIWNSVTGKLLDTIDGFKATFSPDGKTIATISWSDSINIWESANRKLLHTFKAHDGWITSISYSPDSKSIITTSWDNTARLWDVSTGQLLHTLQGHGSYVDDATFSPDGKAVVTASWDKTAMLWDVSSGQLLHAFKGHTWYVNTATVSPDGNFIATAPMNPITKIWDAHNGQLKYSFKGHTDWVQTVFYSPDGNTILTASWDYTAKLWNAKNGELLHTLIGHEAFVLSAQFSPDGNTIVTVDDFTVKIWDAHNGQLLHSLEGFNDIVNSATYSPDSKIIATVTWDDTVKLWDVHSGRLMQSFEGYTVSNSTSIFSPDNKKIVISSADRTVRVCDVISGKPLYLLEGHTEKISSACFSPDGKTIITASYDGSVKLWDAYNGQLLNTLKGHNEAVNYASFSPDGKTIFTASNYHTAILWDAQTGKILKSIFTEAGEFKTIDWQNNHLITHLNTRLTLWDITTGNKLLSWIAVDSTDWVVIHPSGLFDATPGAMEQMYYVQGLEMIEFKQMKDRYWEPGLWRKVMNGEELRNVAAFGNSLPLYPNIKLSEVSADGNLNIFLTNQGGGIGKVLVYINDKEVASDARTPGLDPNASNAKITYNIINHPFLMPLYNNTIEVKAYNAAGYLVSRGVSVHYSSGGGYKGLFDEEPALYLISCGVSDYTGYELYLKYAAKDAEDMARALEIGAKRLFGDYNTHTYLLISKYNDQVQNRILPTKANIIKTFQEIAQQAKSSDIIVVYLSGHGINWGGQEGDWYYLTQDAYASTPETYNDPAILDSTTLSSNELVELIKKVPALKQVLLIDACASGKVVDNLIARRDISSNTIRALERMKDRTGMHIITGCTADAVSYEANKYGQGVLTYSLIEGVKGAALRDNAFVDINKLFQYSRERVPQLAKGIGGIQEPVIFSPTSSESYDIGLITNEDMAAILLTKTKPVFVRSSFQDEVEMEDLLQLSKKMDDELNTFYTRGSDKTDLIFIDVPAFSESYKLIGRYERTDNKIILKLKIKSDTQTFSYDLEAVDVDELINKIIEIVENVKM